MVTNANSVIQFGSGSAATNQIKYFSSTSLRDRLRVYRVDDSSSLTIGTQIDGSSSTNRTYPILNLVSSIDPTAQVDGVSATSADLFNINWNDKPSPYKSGYPHTYALATTPTSACLYLVSDTINKMMFNSEFVGYTFKVTECLLLNESVIGRRVWTVSWDEETRELLRWRYTTSRRRGTIHISSDRESNC
ncbi:TPA: hypothetical protein N0F65_006450 [Lagenidium giganteum]|uniref:Uncharacterized protein n=1 Tax=Lagenidium giganteum TaxID=4803 RepID=A0AAV2Z2B2_9STRA|nr:TPA: hypothetical protein N0F65_006450 [Lagenidium giganteum]